MADASRFPHLALPFAIVGAAGGWLSAELLANPVMGMMASGKGHVAAGCAMLLMTAGGALITRWCVGKRYAYELASNEPGLRAPADRWPLHVGTVIAIGAATGAAFAELCDTWGGPWQGAAAGAACALVFVPVCLAVLDAARRAQRARLGSIVAGSDRRAVWGILATALAVTTLEALPDWPASSAGIDVSSPLPALAIAVVAGLLVLAILRYDARALSGARGAIEPGLEQRDPAEQDAGSAGLPRLDLGLGEGLLARLARGASAYRGRDRTVALVVGDPEHALAALRRARRRGVVSLSVIAAVLAGHAFAGSWLGQRVYDERDCNFGGPTSCTRSAQRIRARDPERAARLDERGCRDGSAMSCAALAQAHETGSGVPIDFARARELRREACDAGDFESCRRR